MRALRFQFRALWLVLLCLTGRLLAGSGDPMPFPPEAVPDPNVRDPSLVTRVEAVYSEVALARRLQDEVWVAFVVTETGDVADARAFFSRVALFEAPAVAAVKHWKFRPATMNGHPIATRMVVAVRFTPP